MEIFHPLDHDFRIFLKRRISPYIFQPLCHNAYIFWKRRIKSRAYIFSSKLSWANSDVMIPSVCKFFVCFINGQTWNPHPTSVSSSTTLHTNFYKPIQIYTKPTYQSYKHTYTLHTYPNPECLPYTPKLPLQTYTILHTYPQNTKRSSPMPVNFCFAWLFTITLLDLQKIKETSTVRAVWG